MQGEHSPLLPFDGYVVVDDNMYLRSMRRQVYNLTRDTKHALLTVHVTCELDVARERNQTRDGIERVAERSFDNIIQDFQVPNSRHICDRNLIEVKSDYVE